MDQTNFPFLIKLIKLQPMGKTAILGDSALVNFLTSVVDDLSKQELIQRYSMICVMHVIRLWYTCPFWLWVHVIDFFLVLIFPFCKKNPLISYAK